MAAIPLDPWLTQAAHRVVTSERWRQGHILGKSHSEARWKWSKGKVFFKSFHLNYKAVGLFLSGGKKMRCSAWKPFAAASSNVRCNGICVCKGHGRDRGCPITKGAPWVRQAKLCHARHEAMDIFRHWSCYSSNGRVLTAIHLVLAAGKGS